MAFYVGGFVTAILYACILEKWRWWDPDWIWLVAAIGAALTGCWVQAYTLYGDDVPTLTGREAMVWINWRWVYFFIWAAVPIVLWQFRVSFNRLQRIINALIQKQRGGNGNQSG